MSVQNQLYTLKFMTLERFKLALQTKILEYLSLTVSCTKKDIDKPIPSSMKALKIWLAKISLHVQSENHPRNKSTNSTTTITTITTQCVFTKPSETHISVSINSAFLGHCSLSGEANNATDISASFFSGNRDRRGLDCLGAFGASMSSNSP